MEATLTPNAESKSVPKKAVPLDVAKRIQIEAPRLGGEEIIAKPVYGDYFRVNWFAKDKGEIAVTHRIVRSQFMKAVVLENGTLVMEDKTLTSKPRSTDLLAQHL